MYYIGFLSQDRPYYRIHTDPFTWVARLIKDYDKDPVIVLSYINGDPKVIGFANWTSKIQTFVEPVYVSNKTLSRRDLKKLRSYFATLCHYYSLKNYYQWPI